MSEAIKPNFYETSLLETRVFISRAFQQGENPENIPAAGDTLTRTCVIDKMGKEAWETLGAGACRNCIYYENYPEDAEEAKQCSERNLITILEDQDIEPANFLMVSVTENGVGFYDTIDATKVKKNEFGNYEQIAGYNAFFARKSEKTAVGSRLADCGHWEIEATLPDGDLAFGFVHSTRTNMQGEGAETFYDGDTKVNYLAHVINEFTSHYGVEPGDVRIKLTAAIDKLVYSFKPDEGKGWSTAEEAMDGNFAGWFDNGLLNNMTNPNWKRGDPIQPTDVWHGNYHGMLEHMIARTSVPTENIDMTEILNPGIIESGHASNVAGKHGKRPEARDLYVVKVA